MSMVGRSRVTLVTQAVPQRIASVREIIKNLRNRWMIYGAAVAVALQILLADISHVGRILIFGEQVIKRLIAARAHVLGDRFVPLFAVGKDRIDIENNPAEAKFPVAYDIANRETGASLQGGVNDTASLLQIECRTVHCAVQYNLSRL